MKPLILTLLLAATSAHAEFVTGNKLFENMASTDATRRTFALAYVAGVHDAGRGILHCSPESITVGQVNDMTKQLLERLPAERHLSADQFVIGVLQEAYPCAQKPTGRGT